MFTAVYVTTIKLYIAVYLTLNGKADDLVDALNRGTTNVLTRLNEGRKEGEGGNYSYPEAPVAEQLLSGG